ncbi:MAG: hypothetical protein MAG453_01692 [Calditrichaeota bacterium]|nr:hypothetical protein [Calditrichota bacterium]
MRRTLLIFPAALILSLFLSRPAFPLVNPRGSDTTIDVATWNLEQFPLEGGLTVNIVATIVDDLALDLIGVQEITDAAALETVAANAGGWSALYSTPYAGGLRFGVLYDNDKVEVTGDPYSIPGAAFTRNPYVVPLQVTENDHTLAFHLVVVHLKAYDTPEDRETRRQELLALKDYLDDQLDGGATTRWLVAGDYNDELDDPDEENVFTPFLADEDSSDLTHPLAGSLYWASYPFLSVLIDHLMVTADLNADYGDEGAIETLRLDDEYEPYFDYVSDHRPVAAYFPAYDVAVEEYRPATLPEAPSLSLWPVPANAAVTISWQLPAPGGTVAVFDLTGRPVWSGELRGMHGRLVWPAADAASGIYLVRVTGPHGAAATARAVIVK